MHLITLRLAANAKQTDIKRDLVCQFTIILSDFLQKYPKVDKEAFHPKLCDAQFLDTLAYVYKTVLSGKLTPAVFRHDSKERQDYKTALTYQYQLLDEYLGLWIEDTRSIRAVQEKPILQRILDQMPLKIGMLTLCGLGEASVLKPDALLCPLFCVDFIKELGAVLKPTSKGMNLILRFLMPMGEKAVGQHTGGSPLEIPARVLKRYFGVNNKDVEFLGAKILNHILQNLQGVVTSISNDTPLTNPVPYLKKITEAVGAKHPGEDIKAVMTKYLPAFGYYLRHMISINEKAEELWFHSTKETGSSAHPFVNDHNALTYDIILNKTDFETKKAIVQTKMNVERYHEELRGALIDIEDMLLAHSKDYIIVIPGKSGLKLVDRTAEILGDFDLVDKDILINVIDGYTKENIQVVQAMLKVFKSSPIGKVYSEERKGVVVENKIYKGFKQLLQDMLESAHRHQFRISNPDDPNVLGTEIDKNHVKEFFAQVGFNDLVKGEKEDASKHYLAPRDTFLENIEHIKTHVANTKAGPSKSKRKEPVLPAYLQAPPEKPAKRTKAPTSGDSPKGKRPRVDKGKGKGKVVSPEMVESEDDIEPDDANTADKGGSGINDKDMEGEKDAEGDDNAEGEKDVAPQAPGTEMEVDD
ncbi:hypothetical protein HGRIS_006563 [Hohenbuehelia grisea]|uniref:Uncharacterized protein n=1 Tax=Hohenbuehelia grisea TaxID=104357 RepID=A0ABR3J9W7_9AGAR